MNARLADDPLHGVGGAYFIDATGQRIPAAEWHARRAARSAETSPVPAAQPTPGPDDAYVSAYAEPTSAAADLEVSIPSATADEFIPPE